MSRRYAVIDYEVGHENQGINGGALRGAHHRGGVLSRGERPDPAGKG
jgi:hypothetical protein